MKGKNDLTLLGYTKKGRERETERTQMTAEKGEEREREETSEIRDGERKMRKWDV